MKKRFWSHTLPISALGLYLMLIFVLQWLEKDAESGSIKDIFDAAWFSIVTLTTVGYGDYYPVTNGGKVIGLIMVLCSLGLMGYIVGNLSTKISRYMEKKKLGLLGTKFENHVVIIGWDDFGREVANNIVQANHKVAIVTNQKDNIDLIKDLYHDNENVFALFADFENYEALENVNIKKANCIFLNLKDDTEVLVYMLNLKNQYPHQEIVVSLNNSRLKDTFKNAGVTYVISKNDIASKLVASFIFEPEVAAFTEDIMATAVHFKNDFDMQQFRVIKGNPYISKDCLHVFMDMKKRYDCIFMGLGKHEGEGWKLYKNPSEEVSVELGDYIIVVSNIESKDKIEADFGVEEGKTAADLVHH